VHHRVTLSQNAPYALNAPSSYVSSAAGVNPVTYRQWQTQECPTQKSAKPQRQNNLLC